VLSGGPRNSSNRIRGALRELTEDSPVREVLQQVIGTLVAHYLNRIFRTFGVLTHSCCKRMGASGSGMSRARSSSTPARPYIWRLIVFSRLT
jgi:hypothetical protein